MSGRPFRFRQLIFSLLILAALALLGLYDSLCADLPAPDTLDRLVWRDICPLSGRLAGPDCPYSRREVFIAGSEPQTECDQHVTVPVDRRTGEPATDDTLAGDVVERVYWLPPPELREWARANGIPQLAGGRVSEWASQRVSESASRRVSELVVLTSPDSLTALAITPFIPREHQRIAVEAEIYTEGWPQRVILYADGQVLAELSQPPYRALWTLEAGEHTFHAVAMAQDGDLLESEPISVLVEE